MNAKLTAKALRERLAELPDDTPIVVDGYENGMDYADTWGAWTVVPSGREGYWSGELKTVEVDDEGTPFAAFYIGRGDRG